MIDPYCHTSSIAVDRPAEVAFEIMADGLKQGAWTLGSLDRREIEPGLFAGTSLFDGAEIFVRLHPDRDRLVVDYEVGRGIAAMRLRNMARVIPGPLLDLSPDRSVVTLMTWRLAGHSDMAWAQTCSAHETEMFIIKGLLERDLP